MNVFFSYSHQDEGLRDELESHLSILKRSGRIHTWHDRKITPGGEWAGAIDNRLEAADVILLLVSPPFLASDYCWDVELRRAMERHEAGEARVIPVILRPVDWHDAPFGKLQALPKDARPVTSWPNRDEAFLDVARGLRAMIEEGSDRRNRPAGAEVSAAAPEPDEEPAARDTSPADFPVVRARSIKAKNVAGVQIQGAGGEAAARLAGAGLGGEVEADEIEAENVAAVQLQEEIEPET